jgi:hypothetical protein
MMRRRGGGGGGGVNVKTLSKYLGIESSKHNRRRHHSTQRL